MLECQEVASLSENCILQHLTSVSSVCCCD